jgi:hypothetical protein
MRVSVQIEGDLNEIMRAEYKAGERAVTGVMRQAATALKADWRGQVVGSGLGMRLGNAIRGESYPKGTDSMNAAALIYSKAPKITAAHEAGPLIRAINRRYLAIPTAAAGKKARGESITPAEWQFKTGKKLRFVYRRGKTSLLVLDQGRISSRGLAAPNRGRRRKDGFLAKEQTIVIFTLVPQVKLTKRLNLFEAAERYSNSLPSKIVAGWKS